MSEMHVWKDVEGEKVGRELIKRESDLLWGYDLLDLRFVMADKLPSRGGCGQFVQTKKIGKMERWLIAGVPKEMPDEDNMITPPKPIFVIARPYPDLLPHEGGLEPVILHGLLHIVARLVVIGHGRDGGFDSEVKRYGTWHAGLKIDV